MEVVIVDSPAEMGALVAAHVVARISAEPDALVGIATGSTPEPVYTALESMDTPRETWARVRFAMLDEYIGLPAGHVQSYRSVLLRQVIEPLGLAPSALHGPDLHLPPEEIGPRYEQLLASMGGVDLQILGIGADGHIGFNEPGSSLGSRTRWKTLTHRTRLDNARFFSSIDDVPHHVITQGLATIGASRHAFLLATGEHKAGAVAAAIEGPVSARCPASVLQFHPHVTAVVDEPAASRLELADYYRETYHRKPQWQSL